MAYCAVRPSFNTGRIEHLYLDEWVRDMKKNRLVNLHYGDMTDSSSLIRIIQQVQPDEIYNLAAQSHVKVSFDVPEYTAEADAVGTLRMLEAVRILGMEKKTRIYQASTSELFGKVQEVPQKETTPFYPRSPYGVAKQYGFWITKNYRESYDMYAVNGILFNHESERRGETFVTRKLHWPQHASHKVSKTNCIWEIWTHAATGDMPKIMWNVCGSSCNMTNRKTSSSPPVRCTPYESLLHLPLKKPA